MTVLDKSTQFRADGLPAKDAFYSFSLSIPSLIDELPAWWSPARDKFLRRAYHDHSMIAGIVYGESARVKNADYTLINETDGVNEEAFRVYQRMMAVCDFGSGLPSLLGKVALDLLTQDNGAFIEIIAANANTESPISPDNPLLSIAYLDAACCWRTFDPEYPVIYINPYTGEQRIMHHSRVIRMANFEQGYELGRGIGLCALSRAFEAYHRLRSMDTYVTEKVNGQSPEVFYTNLPAVMLDDAFAASAFKNESYGRRVFKDTLFVGPKSVMAGMPDITFGKVGLKEAPDGFDYKEDSALAIYAICTAFGVDAREYFPATASGATKADAELQDAKAASKGINDLLSQIEYVLNWRVLPDWITFKFSISNPITERNEADTRYVRAQTRQLQLLSGEITRDEARQLAAQYGDIEPGMLEVQNVAETDAAVQQKSYDSDVRTPFYNALVQVLESDSVSKSAEVQDLVKVYGIAAYFEGLDAGGARGITSIAELEQDERDQLYALLNSSISRAAKLVNEMRGATPEQIESRAMLWANKGLDSIYNEGLLTGDLDRAMEWQYGDTEHCLTCLSLNGKVYRASTWRKYIQPRSEQLECKGFNCQCQLVETNKPIMPGVPFGSKDHHAH